MKFTQYLQRREVGFAPKGSKLKSTKCVETLVETHSVDTIKNTPCKLSGQPRATFLVDFSTDRTKVASTHGDHSVRVSDIVSGKCTHVLVGHPRTPWCLSFHPSSNDILASGCLGGEVRIWDLLGGGSEVWQAPNGTVIASLTFHPTDHVLLFATSNSVYFWDWSQPEPFAVCKTNYEYERVRWLGFDPLGHYIYTGITNVTTMHRDDPPNIVHIRDRTGHHPNSRLRNNWPRYQHLVERFHSYQRGRLRNRDDEDMDQAVAGIPRPLSPIHIDGINLARQFAAEVTTSATDGPNQSRPPQIPPRRSSSMPVNILWDIGEDISQSSPLTSHPQRMRREHYFRTARNHGEDTSEPSQVPVLPVRHSYFPDPRTRDWSPPPRASSEEDDSLVDEEIERLYRSPLRHPESRYRSRLAARSANQSRSDRSQRRLAVFSEFMRRRGRNPDGSRMLGNNSASSTTPRGYLSTSRPQEYNMERSVVTTTSSNEFIPLIDRLNDINGELQNVMSSALDRTSTTSSIVTSTVSQPSLLNSVPRVSSGFPPARITGLRQPTTINTLRLPVSLGITPSTVPTSSLETRNPLRVMTSVARTTERSIINSCLSGHNPQESESVRETSNNNLVVQRQSGEESGRLNIVGGNVTNNLPSVTTSTVSSATNTVSINNTLFVDQPLPAPTGNTEENRNELSCSRTRPPYRSAERSGSPISRLRRQLAACRNTRQRMLRQSRCALSRTPQAESFRNPLAPNTNRIPLSSASQTVRCPRLSRTLTSTISSSLFSPGRNGTVASTSTENTTRSSVLQRHWSPPAENRTVVTDQTSQTSGTMNHPECSDQGTDVVGLNLDLELPEDDEDDNAMDDESEQDESNYFLYDSDTITDSSLTVDLSDEANPIEPDMLVVDIPLMEDEDDDHLPSFPSIITSNDDTNLLEPVSILDESVTSESTSSTLSGLNDSSTCDLASVSSLCQFVNHYNRSSPINITAGLTPTSTFITDEVASIPTTLETAQTSQNTAANDDIPLSALTAFTTSENNTTTSETSNSNLLSSLGLTPTSLSVSNTVVVSSNMEDIEVNSDESSASEPPESTTPSNVSVTNNVSGSPPSLPDDDPNNNCPAHTVLRHHAYLANATARLERRISELDQRIGRSNSAISSSGLNNREDLASITARLERQVSELDHRINALRQSFTERLRALHQDRDRILSMRGRLSGEPDSSSLPVVPPTTDPTSLPLITITRARDETRELSTPPTFPITTSQSESVNTNRRRLLESFLRAGGESSTENASSTDNNSSQIQLDRGERPSEDESWHSLQQIHLHPHYSASILDDTINRPNDALQAAINRAIAGAFMGTGESAVANNIVPQSHRIQWWDFTQYQVPDLKNTKSNIIVPVCKLHNDASCDISQDGTRLATFVPSHRGFPDDNILAVFSLETNNFAHCLFTKSFGPNAISVSISPRNDHVIIGLAAKRLSWVFTTHQLVAQIYELKEPHAGEESMKHVTGVFHTCDSDVRTHVSVNSARWLPRVGEGLVYGTNRGDLVICRSSAKTVTQKAEVADISTSSASEREGSDTTNPPQHNLSNLFQTRSAPQTLTTATQTISRGIRRTAGTQTPADNSDQDNSNS